MIGIINIDKPEGITSHGVVNTVRRALNIKRVGHAGTLDPMATGVLPVMVGKATLLSDHFMGCDKSYSAIMKLGIITDTQDITGTVLEKRTINVNAEQVTKAAESFVGKMLQTPPMFSAVKMGGRKLCDLARRGEEVERPKREIRINSLKVQRLSEDSYKVDVGCSKGTYIRTLIHDIGMLLGTGATTQQLRRTGTGVFTDDWSVPLEQFKQSPHQYIKPISHFFSHCRSLHLDANDSVRVKNGVWIPCGFKETGDVLLYDQQGQLICIAYPFGGKLKIKYMVV